MRIKYAKLSHTMDKFEGYYQFEGYSVFLKYLIL